MDGMMTRKRSREQMEAIGTTLKNSASKRMRLTVLDRRVGRGGAAAPVPQEKESQEPTNPEIEEATAAPPAIFFDGNVAAGIATFGEQPAHMLEAEQSWPPSILDLSSQHDDVESKELMLTPVRTRQVALEVVPMPSPDPTHVARMNCTCTVCEWRRMPTHIDVPI